MKTAYDLPYQTMSAKLATTSKRRLTPKIRDPGIVGFAKRFHTSRTCPTIVHHHNAKLLENLYLWLFQQRLFIVLCQSL